METQKKTMYVVTKYKINECPHCKHPLRKHNEDFVRFMGEIRDGEKVHCITPHQKMCVKCDKRFTHEPLKSYQIGSKKEAERLVAKEGYSDLTKVEAVGNHCQDSFTDYTLGGKSRIEIISCEEGHVPKTME